MLRQPYSGFTRIACNEPCEIEDETGSHPSTLWNVSVLGAYVVVQHVLDVGQQLVLSFRLPGDPTPIRARVRVAWANPPARHKGLGDKALDLPPGFGLEFVGLDPADLGRIEARVQQTYPAPH